MTITNAGEALHNTCIMSKDYFKKRKTAPIVVICKEVRFLDLLTAWDGTKRLPKEDSYADPCPQFGWLLFGIVSGIFMVVRGNDKGYARATDADVDEAAIKAGELVIKGKYVCEIDADPKSPTFEKLIRVESAKRTATCHRMVDQFLNAAGIVVADGVNVIDAMESVPGLEQKFVCECYNDPYDKGVDKDGKPLGTVDNWKVRNFKPMAQEDEVAATTLVDKDSNDLDE